MDIKAAILKAQETQKGITREEWMPGGIILIPTNTSNCFIIIPLNKGEVIGRRWNPKAEDILATDWRVIG